MRLFIIESDSATAGSAIYFLEDECRLQQIVASAFVTSGGLHDRVTGQRHQCVWDDCMKMEEKKEEGGEAELKVFSRCSGCKLARYCRVSCQKKAWGKGNHKRVCKMYQEVLKERVAAAAAATEEAGK